MAKASLLVTSKFSGAVLFVLLSGKDIARMDTRVFDEQTTTVGTH